MFKNAIIYRLPNGFPMGCAELEEKLKTLTFLPCGATQIQSYGFVPPRGDDHGALAESVGGQIILKLTVETKSVPADVVNRRLDADVKRYKAETGNERVGKKIKNEMKEEILLSLLQNAFPKRSSTLIWIDPAARLLVVDAGSSAAADVAISALVSAMEGLAVHPLQTQQGTANAMAQWLSTQQAPAGFTIDRACELKATDESKAVVRYANHALEIQEVVQHIASGKQPTKLALAWNGRVSFVLTDALVLKKIDFPDVVADESGGDTDADAFDADVAIATGELRGAITDLIQALGGELTFDAEGVPH